MVEQSHACEGHGDVVFVASVDNMVVANRPTSLRDKVNTAFMCAFDVVAKGEKGITT